MLDTFEATSPVDSLSLTGKILLLTTCDTMEFAEMVHCEVCIDLPVSLLRLLHAKQLECTKSMKLMASFHCSHFHLSRWNNSAVSALPDLSLLGIYKKVK